MHFLAKELSSFGIWFISGFARFFGSLQIAVQACTELDLPAQLPSTTSSATTFTQKKFLMREFWWAAKAAHFRDHRKWTAPLHPHWSCAETLFELTKLCRSKHCLTVKICLRWDGRFSSRSFLMQINFAPKHDACFNFWSVRIGRKRAGIMTRSGGIGNQTKREATTSGKRWGKCGGCRKVYYWSKKCQKQDWNLRNHAKQCKR